MRLPLWRRAGVSSDETHHLIDGLPLYKKRFLRVLSFHEPGLAAVCEKKGAYHINIHGRSVYASIFIDAVGFYENLAAVQEEGGWRHVRPDGVPAYNAFYVWCGNFQGGRAAVRGKTGYYHILPDGRALYNKYFLYVGDFRERRAVVRLDSGLCRHIGEDGKFAHSICYHDLDVYHKGFARARDEYGWMHIGGNGRPAYRRRFAMVEPFYNGRALAETLTGEIVTIDKTGNNIETIVTEVPSVKTDIRTTK